MQARLQSINLANDAQRANILSMSLDNEVKEFNNLFLGIEKQISLQSEMALYDNLIKHGNLTEAQAREKLTQSYLNVAQSNYYGQLQKEVAAKLPLIQSDVALQTAINELGLAQLPTAENIAKMSPDDLTKLAETLGIPVTSSPKEIANRYVSSMLANKAMIDVYGSMSSAYDSKINSLLYKSGSDDYLSKSYFLRNNGAHVVKSRSGWKTPYTKGKFHIPFILDAETDVY